MKTTLREAAGSLLVVGLAGTELTSLERAWLRLVRPGGVILFRRNIADAAQTRALLEDATGLCARNAFRCVDVEGGTVDRLRDALAPLPSAQAVTAAERAKGRRLRVPLAEEHGVLVGRAVRAFGFNATLAPVLDLGLPVSAGVMGTRTAGEDAAAVVAYARSFLRGLGAQGIVGCGKHFPGLGGGMRDSHQETPAIERSWNDLWMQDLEPYRALRRELPMVMVNHAAYPRTRSKDAPASVSPFWITKVLREEIGYRGLIFSDDMEMGGILKFMPMEEAVVAAVRAGMDTVEICHSPELILRAYEALLSEAERSTAFAQILSTRARETHRKRAKMFSAKLPPAVSERQLEALRNQILRFRKKVAPDEAIARTSGRPLAETA